MMLLETERLILRGWRESDYLDLYEYAKMDEVGPNAGWAPHKSEEESKEIIRYFLKNMDTYAIELKKENKVIGSIGFHQRTPDLTLAHLNQREVGFALHPKYWGNELVPEAVRGLLHYGFNTLNLDLVWCGHFDFNKKSKRVNEKCGFTYRFSKTQKYKLFNNKLVTSLYYSITKLDYQQRDKEFSSKMVEEQFEVKPSLNQ